MNNAEMVRRLVESIKKQAEEEIAKGQVSFRSTIRHLEAASDDSNVRLLTSLPAYAAEATD